MRRELFASLVGLSLGCSHAGTSPVDDWRYDAGGDAAEACLFCEDAGTLEPWQNTSLPLGTRMKSMLGGCDGAEACHSAGSGGLVITGGGKEFVNLVGVPSTERPELLRVSPGDPAASYLWLKLRGDGGIDGSPMPSGSPDPRRAALARDWIEAGAPLP